MFEKPNSANPHWEGQILQDILLKHIIEQRRARRWSIFFKLLFISFLGFLFYQISSRDVAPAIATQPHTALIDIKGEIGAGEEASADNIRDALKAAFESKQVKGVVLRINSGGGSPVQARQIYTEIRNQRSNHPDIMIYAAIEDMGASAAYLIASATDAIYADKTSLVGSIGAKIATFGFVDAMHKVGIERRIYVAGKHKSILDPFLPREPNEEAFLNEQLRIVHQAFIDNVKEGRGTRLQSSPDLFTGLFWSGEQALSLGLTDGYGDAQYIAKEIIKVDNLVDYTPAINLIEKISRRIGTSIGTALATYGGLIQNGVR